MNNEAIVKGAAWSAGERNQKEGIREDENATVHLIVGRIDPSLPKKVVCSVVSDYDLCFGIRIRALRMRTNQVSPWPACEPIGSEVGAQV